MEACNDGSSLANEFLNPMPYICIMYIVMVEVFQVRTSEGGIKDAFVETEKSQKVCNTSCTIYSWICPRLLVIVGLRDISFPWGAILVIFFLYYSRNEGRCMFREEIVVGQDKKGE